MANSLAKGGTGSTNNNVYYATPSSYGNYQFITLSDIVINFNATYVGEGKILANTLEGDINYHAHRALQELSYDTLKSCKAIEITLPPSLIMILPNDYINYTKITWSDANGIERIIYPTSKTSNPDSIQQDPDGNYLYDSITAPTLSQNEFNVEVLAIAALSVIGTSFSISPSNPYGSSSLGYGSLYPGANILEVGMEIHAPGVFPPGTKVETVSVLDPVNPTVWSFTTDKPSINIGLPLSNYGITIIATSDTSAKYKSSGSNSVSVNTSSTDQNQDIDNYFTNNGGRRGIDPQYAQANGSFYIDCKSGKIHFSSNLAGKTIILHYLSDHHGDPGEEIVHKFAEEAMYKWIAYGCASARSDVPEGVIQRLKRERFAETRKAKIRLSNVKIEEITQTIRGKSKWIKH